MKRIGVALSAALVALAANVAAAQVVPLQPLDAPSPSTDAGAVHENASLWFVELASPPVADGGSQSAAKAEKAAFRRAAAREGLRLEERRAFDTLFNGLSVAISPADVGKLARLEGVKAIYPVETIRVPVASPTVPDLLTALSLTGADVAQSELGYTGQGVKVAVMDTGIDYDHLAFGGDGSARSNSPNFPNARVVAGWDFVGDDFNADPTSPTYNPATVPDAFPDDCQGHGTHVAGIVGASPGGPFAPAGVAPGVTFGAYRVFGCDGSTTADVMIAAMERALADGMHVLNMSIGSSFQWPQYPTAEAATRLVNSGMVVVASIGNSGTSGLYAVGAPGVGNKVIGVASFDNTHVLLALFRISPDDTAILYGPAAAAPAPPTAGTFPMARTGTPATANDACNPLPAGSLAGKVALVRRGTCSFHQKSLNAQNAGAAGVVLYNNVAGRFSPTVAGSPAITIPVVAISDAEGVLIDSRLAAGPVDMTWTDQLGSSPNATAGLLSSFSSYGLPPDLSLKPDLGAPGGLIWSTYPIEQGSYATLSGTSMASPHVAGAVALLLEARPNTPAQTVRSLLQNTAVPAPWSGNPGLGFRDGTWRQGAGMLRIDAAIQATARVQPGKLALGESQAGPVSVSLEVRNDGPADVTYDLSYVNSVSVRNTFPAHQFFLSDATVSFTAPSVTVPAGGTATVLATVTPPTGPDRGLYGGWIALAPQGGGQMLRVPYAGFVGDYQSIPVLVPTANGFPWLAKLTGTSFFNQPGGATYTLAEGDIPYFLVHFDHPSRMLKVRIFDAVTGKAWHDAFREDYLPRNSTSTGFFSFPWDGTTTAGRRVYTVPNGQYVAVFEVQKALATAADPVETWTSPIITIARP